MSWIDCRVRMPMEADANENEKVLVKTGNGTICVLSRRSVNTSDVAWMPIPEFTPVPDPPDGYEFLQDYNAEPHQKAKWFDGHEWRYRDFKIEPYYQNSVYVVPIKPPEPQYRPFANAEEFRPYRDRWWRSKDNKTLHPPAHYNDRTHHCYHWDEAFEKFEFEDGTPFGLPVTD